MNSTHTQPTQADQILAALDALREFGCMRLGARILELKEADYPIKDEWVKTGKGKQVKRYFLPSESDQSDTPDQSEPATQTHHTDPR